MATATDDELASHFLNWQCRIRQIAMRQNAGRPSAAMTPRVMYASGSEAMPAMTVLLMPGEPETLTVLFEFQAQKSTDPRQVYEAGLKLLQADYYQKPKTFNGHLTAQFAKDSQVAAKLTQAGNCSLIFDQFAQVWSLDCVVTNLDSNNPFRAHTLAHNRLFNPQASGDATVLQFAPDWSQAEANPMLPGVV